MRFDVAGRRLPLFPFRVLCLVEKVTPGWLAHRIARAFVRFGFAGEASSGNLYVSRSARFIGDGSLTFYGAFYLYDFVEIRAQANAAVTLSDGIRVNVGTMLRSSGRHAHIEIGSDSYIGPYCVIDAVAPLSIGRDVLIGPHCGIFASTHGTVVTKPYIEQPITGVGIRIGDNVWIGDGARILDGVDIGDGSIVGAGAVVNRSFPPRSLIAGVPARCVRSLDLTTPNSAPRRMPAHGAGEPAG